MQNIHMKKLSMPSLHWLQKIQRNQILQFPRLLPKQAVQDRPFIKNILKISMKLYNHNLINKEIFQVFNYNLFSNQPFRLHS